MRSNSAPKKVFTNALALSAAAALVLGSSVLPANAQPARFAQTVRPAAPELPSDQDIANAKQSESATSTEVSKIETIIGSATQNVQAATAATMRANENYSIALVKLQDYQAKSDAAQAKAELALKASEKARAQLGQLAGEIYKSGNVGTSLPGLLAGANSASSPDLLYQATALKAIGDSRAKIFDNAQSATALTNSLNDAAAESKKAADDAAKTAAEAKGNAESADQAQNAVLSQSQERRTVLVGQLATLRNTSSELEEQRISGLEQQQRQAQLDAIIAASQNRPSPTPPPSTGGGTNPGPGTTPVIPPVAPPIGPPVVPPVVPPVTPPPPVVPPVTPPPVTPPPVTPPPSGVNIAGMVQFMMSKVGGAYVWGGTGPGYDCSGLIWAAFRSVGVNVPRVSGPQFWAAPTKVPLSQMRYGDILAFNDDGAGGFSHVGVYVGNGQMVNALNARQGIMVNRLTDLVGLQIYPYAARY